MIFDDEEAPGPVEGVQAAAAGPSGLEWIGRTRHAGGPATPPVSHPPAYRLVVAGWPEDRRERWGRRANELEEAGLSWRDAETQAFVEVWSTVRQDPRAAAPAPPGSDPHRN